MTSAWRPQAAYVPSGLGISSSRQRVGNTRQLVNPNDLIADRIQDDLAHGVQAEFAHEVASVGLGCLHAAPQGDGNLLRSLPFCNQLQDLPLAAGKGG